ncbi:hypothetical protein KFK09_007642 [Dendrobium nobile]|uniref:Uncharacterized protein n=1 Tax=Dendrobium nobile TaxID=94219 RepID=A0A8T3BX37_DENNO|nr:hypothetical protein KFK09_007642 [Dendrobium nobile]
MCRHLVGRSKSRDGRINRISKCGGLTGIRLGRFGTLVRQRSRRQRGQHKGAAPLTPRSDPAELGGDEQERRKFLHSREAEDEVKTQARFLSRTCTATRSQTERGRLHSVRLTGQSRIGLSSPDRSGRARQREHRRRLAGDFAGKARSGERTGQHRFLIGILDRLSRPDVRRGYQRRDWSKRLVRPEVEAGWDPPARRNSGPVTQRNKAWLSHVKGCWRRDFHRPADVRAVLGLGFRQRSVQAKLHVGLLISRRAIECEDTLDLGFDQDYAEGDVMVTWAVVKQIDEGEKDRRHGSC